MPVVEDELSIVKDSEEQWIEKDEQLLNIYDYPKENDKIKLAEGINLVGKQHRRTEFDLEIEDLINRQGFDGLPRLEKDEDKFYELVKKDHFIGERTISDDNSQNIAEWYNQLTSGEFYVKCTTGGFQYGRGLYCAADYSKGKCDYDKFLHEIKQYSWEKENVKTIWMTLDPSAKIIDFRDIQIEYAYEWIKVNHPEMKTKVNLIKELRNKINNYPKTWDPVYESPPKEWQELSNQLKLLDKEINIKEGVIASNKRMKDDGYDWSILAAEMGYDAINASGHGKTGSYTVVLNRTKLVIYDGEKFKYR